MQPPLTPLDTLRAEFLQRRDKNPRYSLRTFARHLGVPPGRLSEIFAKRRRLTRSVGEKIADRLFQTSGQRRDFLANLGRDSVPPTDDVQAQQYFQLQADAFTVVADWYHFALLSLMETSDFTPSPAWIARRLGISSVEAREAVERLERLGLARRSVEQLVPTHKSLTTSHDIPSSALRRSHAQQLEMARQSLEEISVAERDITSIMLAIDPSRLPEAKEAIKKFRRAMAKNLESGNRSEVYTLSVQLFPVSKRRR